MRRFAAIEACLAAAACATPATRVADERSLTAMMDQNDGWNGAPWGMGRF